MSDTPFKRGAIVEYVHNRPQFAKFDGAIGVILGPASDPTRWIVTWIVADNEQHRLLAARRAHNGDEGYPEYLLHPTGEGIDLDG